MARTHLTATVALAAILTAGTAWAQSPQETGRYVVYTIFSAAEVERSSVTVAAQYTGDRDGQATYTYTFIREGSMLGGPARRWTSTSVRRVRGDRLEVIYDTAPAPRQAAPTLISGLSGERSRTTDASTEVVKAIYSFGSRGQVREALTRRNGPPGGWSAATGTGTREALKLEEAKALPAIRAAIQKETNATYDYLAGEAKTDAERARLEADRKTDLAMELWLSPGDWHWHSYLTFRVTEGRDYRNAQGQVVPRDAQLAVVAEYMPEHAGIILENAFVFDTRTWELLDASEVTDSYPWPQLLESEQRTR